MGAAGCVGPAGVTLQFAIAQSGARLWGNAAGARPRPPPIAALRGSSIWWRGRVVAAIGVSDEKVDSSARRRKAAFPPDHFETLI